mmetsp:Transcript_45976/g.144202  ORF Transcript_45976/g.144202 Transcript_45976/m.144202 type:complete len:275 (-) Transcript_45976:267-1091(-)
MVGRRGMEGRGAGRAWALKSMCSMLIVVSLSEGLGSSIGPFQAAHVPAQAKAIMMEASGTTTAFGYSGEGLNLRGGGIKAQKRSASNKRKGSASRSRSLGSNGVKKKKSLKKKQPSYNLPKDGWFNKIKKPELQRPKISMKGSAKGRKKPVFHFWTKSKTKLFIAQRVKHAKLVKKMKEKLPLKFMAKGVKRCKWEWLPSIREKEILEMEEKRKAEEKAAMQAEDGNEGEGEGEGGEAAEGENEGETVAKNDGGGFEDEDENFLMGMGGDDSEF